MEAETGEARKRCDGDLEIPSQPIEEKAAPSPRPPSMYATDMPRLDSINEMGGGSDKGIGEEQRKTKGKNKDTGGGKHIKGQKGMRIAADDTESVYTSGESHGGLRNREEIKAGEKALSEGPGLVFTRTQVGGE